MSDTTIPALLEELREVDEAAWDKIQYGVVFGEGLDECRVPYEPMEVQMAHDHLQGCIQRAIAARPDHWIISQWMSQDKWQAMIRRGPRGYIDPEYMHIGEGDTPAAAILAAYIEAVRARQ